MKKISLYQAEKVIYQSVNSIIYKGFHEVDDRAVIIKLMNYKFPKPSIISKFKREYQITKNLNFNTSLKAYSFEKYNNTYAIILEDFGGKSLEEAYPEQFNFELFLDIAIKCCDQLQNIHSRNIIHKDINPGNIIWNHNTGELKIIDFGISTITGVSGSESTIAKDIEGTIPYISPEQTGRINRLIDYRTDLYSLGITFYQLITLELPFKGNDLSEVIHQHIALKPIEPKEKNSSIPEILSDIVMKLISKNPEERYQSIAGLKHDLIALKEKSKNSKKVARFTLAQKDIPEKLQFPRKLFGRKKELQILMNSFERFMSAGQMSCLLIKGQPGIGKSSLIYELQAPALSNNCTFIDGKFDKNQRNIPYYAIIQALKKAISPILSQNPEEIEEWKIKFLKQFNNNGQVLVDLLPELEYIIGPQEDVLKLGQLESQNRLNSVFQNFIKIIADKSPLILFIDDLQWADHSSLNLLLALLQNQEIKSFFLILSFRDNENNLLINPFIKSIEKEYNNKKYIDFISLELDDLKLVDLNHWLSELLHTEQNATKDLSAHVLEKTKGNPFFIIQLIKSFNEKGILFFNTKEGRWDWRFDLVRNEDYTENVIQLIINKLKVLNQDQKKILKISSCLGMNFNILALNHLSNLPFRTIHALLTELISQEYIVSLSNEFKYLNELNEIDENNDVQLKFSHDRIHQSIYSMISENERKKFHLKIAEYLLTKSSNKVKNLYGIVNHYNQALEQLNSSRRIDVAKLNYDAGIKAKSASAFDQAYSYFNNGQSLLKENDWHNHFDLCFHLHLELAVAEYIERNFSQAENWFNLLLSKAKNTITKIKIYSTMVQLYRSIGDFKKAVDTGIIAFSLSGISCSQPEEIGKFIQIEIQKIQDFMANHSVEDLLNLPPCVNDDIVIIKKLCLDLHPAVFMSGNMELFALITF